MRALTFWPVWAWLVVHGPKNVENRTWVNRIVRELVSEGEPFAVHAAQTQRRRDYEWARSVATVAAPGLVLPAFEDVVCGAVIGIASISELLAPTEVPEHAWHLPSTAQRRYHGWLLYDREPLDRPVPCRGGQGFWSWERAHP